MGRNEIAYGERMAASVEETDIGMLVFTPNGKITLMVHCIVLQRTIVNYFFC